jgi:putative flavoprotein involved in K+ transport
MMHADCYWRDLLTFSWDFKTLHGIGEVKSWLLDTSDIAGAHGFRLEGEPAVGAIGEYSETLEFFFKFETSVAQGRGYVRLVGELDVSRAPKVFRAPRTMSAFLHDYRPRRSTAD